VVVLYPNMLDVTFKHASKIDLANLDYIYSKLNRGTGFYLECIIGSEHRKQKYALQSDE
jgi:hypothetical protein